MGLWAVARGNPLEEALAEAVRDLRAEAARRSREVGGAKNPWAACEGNPSCQPRIKQNPGCLIGGCPLVVGIQTTFGGNTPLTMGRVYKSWVNITSNGGVSTS